MRRGLIFGIAITLLVFVSVSIAYLMGTQKGETSNETISVTQAVISPTLLPTKEIEKSDIPTGWMTYKNEEYGFEISFPVNYEALDDEENLYGWPNAVVLIYSGGQSYDLPIEVWDTESDYEAKYAAAENLVVKKSGDKYITLMNTNFEDEVNQIIATFKISE